MTSRTTVFVLALVVSLVCFAGGALVKDAYAMGPPPSSCATLYYAVPPIATAEAILPSGAVVDLQTHPSFTASTSGGYTLYVDVGMAGTGTEPPGSAYVYMTTYGFFSYACLPAFPGQGFTYTSHINDTFSAAASGSDQSVTYGVLTSSGGAFAEVNYTVDWVASLPSVSTTTTTVSSPPVTMTSTATVTSSSTVTSTFTTSSTVTSTLGTTQTTTMTLPASTMTVTSTSTAAQATVTRSLTTTATSTVTSTASVTETDSAGVEDSTSISSSLPVQTPSSSVQSSTSAVASSTTSASSSDIVGGAVAVIAIVGSAVYYVYHKASGPETD